MYYWPQIGKLIFLIRLKQKDVLFNQQFIRKILKDEKAYMLIVHWDLNTSKYFSLASSLPLKHTK